MPRRGGVVKGRGIVNEWFSNSARSLGAAATQNHRTGVMRIRYQVKSLPAGTVVKTGKTINFTKIPPSSKTTVLYRNAAPFDSNSAYCGTESYY